MRHRGAVRIVPRLPITVAIQDGTAPYAYGVVANISVAGACIWTNVVLSTGRSVSLRLSFPRRAQPIDAEGVVVWGEPAGEAETRRYGLHWTDQSAPRQARLDRIIASSV